MWESLDNNAKAEYKKMILAFASLSEMFAQKESSDESNLIPIINSKYQETVFQKVFKASAEDISNTAYDASITLQDKIFLVGIKTFGFSADSQKIAQFKACLGLWSNIISQIRANAENVADKDIVNERNMDLYKDLANRIAQIRNDRIDSAVANIIGPRENGEQLQQESIYHVLMPSNEGGNPYIHVGETLYKKIDINHIRNISCTSARNPMNFTFEDGIHKYKFTAADCQLYMNFENRSIVKDTWNVTYAEDAYSIFSRIADFVNENETPGVLRRFGIESAQIVESHSWKINVEKSSGYNSFYGVGAKMGEEKRTQRIKAIISKYKVTGSLKNRLELFCSLENGDEKFALRDEIVRSIKDPQILADLKKLLYRPSSEIYIPIPNSISFHTSNPNFFAVGVGNNLNSKELKDKSRFTMVFEPSKTEMECFITQSSGKAIQSCDKQSILGDWILRKVFRLKEYEPLTENRLSEIGINSIRLDKTIDGKIHLSFIWLD